MATPANASVVGAATTEDDSPTSVSDVAGVAQEDGSTVFTMGQSELTIVPSEDPAPSGAELSALAPTLGCSLDVQNVHASVHVSGTINGVAKINCNANAGQLTLHYSLIRVSPNYTQWGAGQTTNAGKNNLQNNRAVSCSEDPGQFRGWAQGEIVPPPGYVLSGPPTYSAYGPLLNVACGLSLTADDGESSISESMSVTFVRADLADAR